MDCISLMEEKKNRLFFFVLFAAMILLDTKLAKSVPQSTGSFG